MRGYILHTILGFLALVLGGVLAFLFYSSSVPSFKAVARSYTSDFTLPKILSDTWRDRMSALSLKDYSPAVSEFYLSFPVEQLIERKKRRVFELKIDQNSFYSRFCLVQTLNSFQIQYKLSQNINGTQIFLDTDNKKLLASIISKLATFKIYTKVNELWL